MCNFSYQSIIYISTDVYLVELHYKLLIFRTTY